MTICWTLYPILELKVIAENFAGITLGVNTTPTTWSLTLTMAPVSSSLPWSPQYKTVLAVSQGPSSVMINLLTAVFNMMEPTKLT